MIRGGKREEIPVCFMFYDIERDVATVQSDNPYCTHIESEKQILHKNKKSAEKSSLERSGSDPSLQLAASQLVSLL